MTNEELIAKIKGEIERIASRAMNEEGQDLCEYLLSFLSTLEEQPKEVRNPIFDECVAKVDPEVREEVRENIYRILEDDSLIDEIKNFIKEYGYERGEDKLLIAIVARHFYELGCRRTAEKYDEIEYNRQRTEESVPNDLEEAADNHIREVADAAGHPGWDWTTQDIADAFMAGAKWQADHNPLPEDTVLFNKGVEEGKRLMMEETVEGEYDQYPAAIYLPAPIPRMNKGDKVKIIIVKED